MKRNDHKTNAMRSLDAAGIVYRARTFSCDTAPSGVEVAHLLRLDESRVFKTLVTQGKSGEHHVFMIPVALELDLKKAASVVHEKAVHMIPSKELLPLTGYIHGGCSPLGMKKTFRTVVDETAELFETIFFSGGRIGVQIELSVGDLGRVIDLSFADLCA